MPCVPALQLSGERGALPAIARDLPAIAVCAGIRVVRRLWRWQAGAGT